MAAPSGAPTPPIWATHLALRAVLISLQQLTDARQEWSSLSSSTYTGIPSLGFAPSTGSAIQPTLSDVSHARVPVEGEAWAEFRSGVRSNIEAVQGLRSFRTAVAREVDHLARIAEESPEGQDAPCPATTNAPSLCSFWEQVLLVSLTRGPVTELNASIVVPPEGQDPAVMAARQRRRKPGAGRISKAKMAKGKGAKMGKVDIVADGGRSWTRLLTIKKNSLLAELRVAESELGAGAMDSSDEEGSEGDDAGLASSGLSEGRAKRLASCGHLFAQLDVATANCSIVRTIEELLACRAAAPPPSPDSSSSEEDTIQIHVVLTRLPVPPPNEDSLYLSMDYLTSSTEEERFNRRLQCLSNLCARLPGVHLSSAADPGQQLTAPRGKILPTALTTWAASSSPFHLPVSAHDFDPTMLALPALPSPVSRASSLKPLRMTQKVNVDVSALVALVSDITHMKLPQAGEGTKLDLQSLFKKGGLKSIAAQDRANAKAKEAMEAKQAAAEGHEDSAEENQGNEDDQGKLLHNRALAAQLGLECTAGCDFMGYLADAAADLSSSSSTGADGQLHLLCTREARVKFDEIMRLVGGPREQARARCLFDSASSSAEFWEGSRYEHDLRVRQAVSLPVEVVDFDWRSVVATSPAASCGTKEGQNFASILRSTLLAGLEDLALHENPSVPAASKPHFIHPAKARRSMQLSGNPRQTQHTLSTLLMGFEKGWTTLTTNMLSVRWLVREGGRRRRTPGVAGAARDAKSAGEEEGKALIWVTHPRSLAERMRAETPSASSAVHGTGMDGSTAQAKTANALPNYMYDLKGATITFASSASTAQQCNDLAPYSLDPDFNFDSHSIRTADDVVAYSNLPAIPTSSEAAWSTVDDMQAAQGSSSSSSRDASASGTAEGSSGTTTAVDPPRPAMLSSYSSRSVSKGKFVISDETGDQDQIQMTHELERGLGRDEEDGPAATYSANSQPRSSTTRPPRTRLHRALRWFAGPHPAHVLTIRHYPWWPFAGIEESWLRLTDHVAWRETGGVELPSDEEDDDEPEEPKKRSTPARWRAAAARRRPAWLRRGMSGEAFRLEEMGGSAAEGHASCQDQDRLPGPRRPHPTTHWQHYLVREYRTNRLHWLLLFLVYVAWLLGFSFLVKSIWSDSSVVSASSGSEVTPSFYGCTTTYWAQNERCGVDGESCRPFSQNTSVAFRCPSGCSGTVLGAARAVGTELPNFTPLIVGGGDQERGVYRGDSWVCPAAVHAGIIDDRTGGCGQLWLSGSYAGFVGKDANGLKSEDFNSTFPVSYFFQQGSRTSKCTDRRNDVYILDSVFSSLVGFVLQPRPIVWLWTLISMGFWHINYASEPRDYPPAPGDPMGDFLPTLFVGYALWRLVFRFVWPAFARLPIERTIWTLGFFWLGVLLNVVFADLPLQRLVASDIAQQPGALTALIIIIVVVIIIAVNQVRVIRKTGYLPKYLTLAAVGGVLIGLLVAVPETGLRLHHYIIALVLLPFTAFETRLSLIYSAFLLGMFLNGVGRWGFDGIIQDESVIQGDSVSNSGGIPTFLNASANFTGLLSLNASSPANASRVYWQPLPTNESYDGFDLMVDDVLRLSATGQNYFDLAEIAGFFVGDASASNATFFPGGSAAANVNATVAALPHYLRLAYTTDGSPGDFTRAAVAYPNGTFVMPEEGRT